MWFWDFCSLNALRALPYLQEWHRRYHERGLRVIGVHSPQFPFARDQDRVQEAVRRLGIEFPVAPDPDYEVWRLYGNEVWPATYLWDRTGVLRFYHFGEGEYDQAEDAMQELLREIDGDAALPGADGAGAPHRPPRRAGAGAHAPPLPGAGPQRAASGGRRVAFDQLPGRDGGGRPGGHRKAGRAGRLGASPHASPRRARLYKLVESGQHEKHELELRFRDDTLAYAFSFAPGPA